MKLFLYIVLVNRNLCLNDLLSFIKELVFSLLESDLKFFYMV